MAGRRPVREFLASFTVTRLSPEDEGFSLSSDIKTPRLKSVGQSISRGGGERKAVGCRFGRNLPC